MYTEEEFKADRRETIGTSLFLGLVADAACNTDEGFDGRADVDHGAERLDAD